MLNEREAPEAEEQLRIATTKNTNAATAHMYFGIVLAVQRKLDEGQCELELAIASNSTDVALAHRYLAGIHLEGDEPIKQAADELQKYLDLVPKALDAEVLHRKIKDLRSKK